MRFVDTFSTLCFAGLLLLRNTFAATEHSSPSTLPDDYFLLISPPASGHANNLILLGSQLKARGHNVVIAMNADEQNIKSRVLKASIDYYGLGDKDYVRFLMDNKDDANGHNPIPVIKFMSDAMSKFVLGLYKDVEVIVQNKAPRVLIYPEFFMYGGHLAHKYNIPGVLIAPTADPSIIRLMDTCPLNSPFLIRSLDPGFFERVLNVLLRLVVPSVTTYFMEPLMNDGCKEIGVSSDLCFPLSKNVPHYGHLAIAPTGYPVSVCNVPHYYKRVGPFVQPKMVVGTDVETWFHEREAENADVIYLSTGSDMVLSQSQVETLLGGIDMLRQKHDRPLYVYYARGQDVLDRYSGKSGLKPEDYSSVYWAKYSPQHWILNQTVTKIFISHCGAGGTNDATYFGVPVYAFPLGRDQPLNAAALAGAGIGIVADTSNLKAATVAEDIHTLLEDEAITDTARRASRINQNSGGVVEAVDLIERYLAIGSNDYNVPFDHNWPWWKQMSLDVLLFLVAVVVGPLALVLKYASSFYTVRGSIHKPKDHME